MNPDIGGFPGFRRKLASLIIAINFPSMFTHAITEVPHTNNVTTEHVTTFHQHYNPNNDITRLALAFHDLIIIRIEFHVAYMISMILSHILPQLTVLPGSTGIFFCTTR